MPYRSNTDKAKPDENRNQHQQGKARRKQPTNTSKAKRRQPTDNGEHHNPHTESVATRMWEEMTAPPQALHHNPHAESVASTPSL